MQAFPTSGDTSVYHGDHDVPCLVNHPVFHVSFVNLLGFFDRAVAMEKVVLNVNCRHFQSCSARLWTPSNGLNTRFRNMQTAVPDTLSKRPVKRVWLAEN